MPPSAHPYLVPNPLIPPAPFAATWTNFVLQMEPFEFTGWMDESESWKKTAYVGDWSALPNKLVVRGPDAIRFFQDISVNSFARFDVGQAKHSIQCAPDGKIVCEGILMRLGEEEVKFTAGPVPWTVYQFEKGNYNATLEQRGVGDFVIQVQGPASLHILEKASGEPQRDYGFMRVRQTQVAGVPVWSLRQGMSGELGFELHGPGEHAIEVHQALLDAGAEFGVRRLGGRTKSVNHVEACFPTPIVDFLPAYRSAPDFMEYMARTNPAMLGLDRYPVDGSHVVDSVTDLYRDPTELGWRKSIKFDHDFIGRDALEPIVANPRRTMTTLVWNKQDVVEVYAALFAEGDLYPFMEMPRRVYDGFAVDSVIAEGREVGVSTSRCYSTHFRDMLSLCCIDVAYAEPGTEVTVIWGNVGGPQTEIRATVAPAPYKRDNRRIDVGALPSYI
jgi:vanillate/3-O-methylgallate O-demethylase